MCIRNTPLTYNMFMVIIETSVFTRSIRELMDDDNYRVLQESLIQKPDMGDLIPGSAGLRKVRWKIEGKKVNVAVYVLSITG